MKQILLSTLLSLWLSTAFAASPKNHDLNKVIPVEQVQLLTDGGYWHAVRKHINQAEQSIWISTFTMRDSKSPQNKVNLLMRLLKKKVKQGVDVYFVLERSKYHKSVSKNNHRMAKKLRKAGIKVFFDSWKKTMHAKVMVIDQRWVIMGSHNLTHSAFTRNHETSVLMDSPKMAATLTRYLKKIAQRR